MAQAIFETDLLPYKCPNNLTPVILHTYPSMKMEQTECSRMLAYKLMAQVNHPEERIQHSEQGESLKSRSREIASSMH
jgi:hypothetical protein